MAASTSRLTRDTQITASLFRRVSLSLSLPRSALQHTSFRFAILPLAPTLLLSSLPALRADVRMHFGRLCHGRETLDSSVFNPRVFAP